MRIRNIVLIAFALLAALGTALLVRNFTEAQRGQAVAEAVPSSRAETAQVLVAARELPAGTLLRPGDLDWQPWPREAVAEPYLVAGEAGVEDFLGAVVRQRIAAREPITQTRVVRPDDGSFLAAILTPGMRAISVPVNATSGIAGFVFPGDRVDLILTHTVQREAGDGERPVRASETVLEDVRVLAVDQRIDDEGGSPVVAKTATLEVSPKQAEAVAILTEMGRLSLSLRSLARDGAALAEGDAAPEGPDAGRSYTTDTELSALLALPASAPGGGVTIVRGATEEAVVLGAAGGGR